jgi:uncharacterized protein YecT (DUF1311 family)
MNAYRSLAACATGLAAFLALGIATPGAGAATARTCAAAGTQLALNTCWAGVANTSDHQVSVAYAHLLAGSAGSQRALVTAAQNAWKSYHDAECEAASATYAGGSMQPMQISICRDRLNRARLADLKADEPQG